MLSIEFPSEENETAVFFENVIQTQTTCFKPFAYIQEFSYISNTKKSVERACFLFNVGSFDYLTRL